MPYLTVYYEGLGLTGRQIGILAAIPSLVTFLSAPLFGAVTDITQRHKQILGISILCVAFGVLAISSIQTFTGLLPVVIMYAFFFGPVLPLIDRSVLNVLADRKDQYGKIRLWGAVGWGIAAPIVGVFIEKGGLQWAFYICAFLMVVLFLVSRLTTIQKVQLETSFFKGISALFKNWQVILFFGVILIGGMGLSLVHNYLFLYLANLGASPLMMGLSLSIATVSELFIMYFSDRLLKMWQARGLILFGLLMIVLRLLGYAIAKTPELALVFQLLHGPTFAAIWIAGVAYVAEIAPPGLGNTVQGLFSGTVQGLGSALGALLGGILFRSIGFSAMFMWMGLAVFVGLILFWVACRSDC